MVEQWNSIGGTVEQSGETVMVEQCGGTVQQCWWNSVVEQWYSDGGTLIVEQWESVGETVWVEQWQGDSGTVWWNSGTVSVEQ